MFFAQIGKGVLIKALGVQHNYKIVTRKKQTISEHCSACPDYLLCNHAACKNCPHFQETVIYDTQYVNEKNKYGYQTRLNKTALKLLIYLHFLKPDKNGIIQNVSFSDLEQKLYCTKKTIQDNLNLLVQYNYIMTCGSSSSNQCCTVLLCEYKKYFLPGKDGGHGYITMSKELFEEIIKIKNVNALRLTLRNYINCDNASYQENLPVRTVIKNYQDLKRYLPRYCNRGIIQKALENNTILHIEKSNESIAFTINDQFNAKEIKQNMKQANQAELEHFIEYTNYCLHNYVCAPEEYSVKLRNIGIYVPLDANVKLYSLTVQKKDITDLTQLSIEYGLQNVLEALQYIYHYFIFTSTNIQQLGALTRSILIETQKAIS